jgi:hypothetical protein
VSDASDERVDSAFAALTDLYRAARPGSELRQEIDAWAENALVAARTVAERYGDPLPADVSDRELESAIEAAEPELAQMITPDSVAEAALLADAPEEHSPLASSGAFATRTMAELLERQGDRRGAARIRAALREPGAPDAAEPDAGAVIAVLERWLENARRLQP